MIQSRNNNFRAQPKSDYEQKLIDIRRVARVVAGGRRFSFRVAAVIGNKKGEVGVGIGKGADTATAIEKAVRDAKRGLVFVPFTPNKSIPFVVTAKYASARVLIKPVLKRGKGLIAGGAVRDVLALAGVQNASAKIISPSKNKINNAKAAIEALKKLKVLSSK